MRWRDLVRGATSRFRQAGRLARWQLFGLTNFARPEHLRLRPPPWRSAPATAAAPATVRVPIVRPVLYGEVEPESFKRIPDEVVVRDPSVAIADDVVLVPGHVFVDRRNGQVLPQSYDIATSGGALTGIETRPPKPFSLPQQAEQLFVVDSHFPGYGHFLLEAIPKLMLLDRAPADIGIATSVPRSATFDAMVGALGVEPSRIRHFNEPVFCRRAFLPERLVHLDQCIHPLARQAFSRIRALGETSAAEVADRIFISRSRFRRRRLTNETQIEALFERHGFRIVHPELLPIEAQIALFSNAKMIAGLGGSAMHNTVFTNPGAKVLIVSARQWFVRTDVLISQHDGQLAYVFGEPDGDSPDVGDADWSVDPAAVEAAIVGHFGL
jgi:capsular polysaccharide biosynthesis protein